MLLLLLPLTARCLATIYRLRVIDDRSYSRARCGGVTLLQALAFATCLAGAGCGGTSKSESNPAGDNATPDMGVDSGAPGDMPNPDTVTPGSVTPGVDAPLDDGAFAATALPQALQVMEDQVLNGRLAYFRAPTVGEISGLATRFAVTVGPLHGELQLDPAAGAFIYRPGADYFGVDGFTFYVTEGDLGSHPARVSLDVLPVNDPPVVTSDITRVTAQGNLYRGTVYATDADNDVLTFRGNGLPGWLELNAATGTLSGLPGQEDVGIYSGMSVTVTDAAGVEVETDPFVIEIIDINDAPVLDTRLFPASMDSGENLLVQVFPDDPDGDQVTLEVEQNDFVDLFVTGGSVELRARGVSELTEVNLVLIAKDLLGRASRTIVPMRLHPLTASGLGRTLHGRRTGAGIHLVVLGDGYKSDEQEVYRAHVENLVTVMRQDPAISAHLSAWNIHTISTPSVNSGVDDVFGIDIRDTAFGSGYQCNGLSRLICTDEGAVFDAALREYPHLDAVVVLVNTPRYGGAGGAVAIASAFSPEILLHELGHSIAGLADEYVDPEIPKAAAGTYVEGRFPNVTTLTDPERVPWAHWIDDVRSYPTTEGAAGIGIFEGAFYQANGFYRSSTSSRMRNNSSRFGAVNGEQWALSVYSRTNPVLDFSPVLRQLDLPADEPFQFEVIPLFNPAIQHVEWLLDGVALEEFDGERTVELTLPSGEYQLEMIVSDISGRIRVAAPHAGEFRWRWLLEVGS